LIKVAFLDRDGTMLDDLGYLTPASEMRVFPWSVDAVRLLNRAGFAVVVVTNQGGVGRGVYDAAFVEATHRRLGERFAAGGAVVDAWQYCPHHPEARIETLRMACACRKPGVGMVEAAGRALGPIDFSRSWVVGDYWRDVQLGHALGARSILVNHREITQIG
jgi:D-glycero-D-manno-heptose 1,7-bisphosphate phosphatase